MNNYIKKFDMILECPKNLFQQKEFFSSSIFALDLPFKFIKTPLHSTMRQDRFNGLALMCCHHDINDEPQELGDEIAIHHSSPNVVVPVNYCILGLLLHTGMFL